MKTRRLATLCVVCIALIACTEDPLPQEPVLEPDACAPAGACEVRGVDLVIEELSLAFPAAYPRDTQTGLPWVQIYDSVPIRYRVRNRGDQTSTATNGWLMSCDRCSGLNGRDVPLRALEPGAVDSGVVMVRATGGFFVTSSPVLDLDAGGRSVDEPFYRNNRRVTAQSYLTVAPDIRGTLELLSPEVRIGTPLRMVLTLRNHARHAILRNDSVAFCFRRVNSYGLDSCDRPFGMRAVASLGPDQQWGDTIDVQLTQQHYLYEKHAAIPVRLDACIGGRAGPARQCAAGRDVVLRPQLESACLLGELGVGEAVSDTFGGVTGACYVYLAQFEVYAFAARAGATYQVQVTSPVSGVIEASIWNRDGEQLGIGGDRTAQATINAEGRYYVVLRRPHFDRPAYDLVVNKLP